MKKLFYFIACLFMLVGCNSDEPQLNTVDESMPATSVEVYGPAGSQTAVSKRTISNYSSEVSITSATKTLNITQRDKDFFMRYFATGENNLSKYTKNAPDLDDFSMDFLYVSDGNPVSIYPIYSNGWYDLTLGLFYYDENGEKQTIDFWNMQTDNWGKPTYDELSRNRRTQASNFEILKNPASGYTITLPENTLFGFYVKSCNDAQSGTFYSAKMENGTNGCHAVSFAHNGKDYLGFEDQLNGDNDLNDLICYINPEQNIMKNPTKDSINAYVKKYDEAGEIEVDIHQQEHKDWGEIKTSVHMRHSFDSIVVEIPIPGDYTIERDDFAVRVYDNYYKMEYENYYVKTVVRHCGDKTTITIKDVSSELIHKLLEQYADGITAEIHCYTKYGMEETVYGYMKQSTVHVYPTMDNCETKIHISSAYGFN